MTTGATMIVETGDTNGEALWVLATPNPIIVGSTDLVFNVLTEGGCISTEWELNNQSGVSYTFAISDAGSVVRSTNASATTFTIDDNATVALPVGSWIRVVQGGGGALTISDSAGVTLKGNGVSGGTAQLVGQNAGAVLYHESTDVWLIEGNLSFGSVELPSYTVLTLPSVTPAGQMIYVSDETGGAVPAFSDGANWLRVTDRAIVS